MNQLTVDTIARKIKRLLSLAPSPFHSRKTYSVVKFMVKVKLSENRVNNHVGNVMVVNVMIQKRAPGMKDRTETRAPPNPEDCPIGAFGAVEFIVAG
jgi:hypothetical protein